MKKKILSVILGLSILLSASITAFATGNEVVEVEGIVPYDNLAYVINLTAGVPTQLYTNSDYTLFDYDLSVRNLIYSPGAVTVTVVTQTGDQLGRHVGVAPGTEAVTEIPGALIGGTDGYSVFVNASVSGQYYFTISGTGVNNPNQDIFYHFIDIEQTNTYYQVKSVAMPLLGTGITVTNSANSPGTVTVRLLDYAGLIIGSEQTIAPGTAYTFPANYGDGQVTVQVKSNTLGTYVLTTEVETLLGE